MQQEFDPGTEGDDSLKSKSQIKREMLALQDLGLKLVDCGNNLSRFELSDTELEAIELARRINRKKDGFRRQIQFIGKLLRKRDIAPILDVMQQLENQKQSSNQHFHQLENWRDRLISEKDTAINALMAEQPGADRQKLRQLVRQAAKQQENNQPPKAAREIFQYLKGLFE